TADGGPIDPVDADVAAPFGVCGIGVGVLGDSASDCSGAGTTADTGGTAADGPATDGVPADGLTIGVLDDLTTGLIGASAVPVDADVAAPLGICGIGVGVLGESASDCSARVASATVEAPPASTPLPVAPSAPSTPSTPSAPADDALGVPAAMPASVLDDMVRGVADSVVGAPRVPTAEAVRTWLAATGSGSGLMALAGVGLSFLLTGLAARKRGIPIG
ncbi:MAG: hypothetical protein M3Y51_01470, partial [Actinomycetota bacterium]|nr:hypothetical protein [Actinomycetota bacterium]